MYRKKFNGRSLQSFIFSICDQKKWSSFSVETVFFILSLLIICNFAITLLMRNRRKINRSLKAGWIAMSIIWINPVVYSHCMIKNSMNMSLAIETEKENVTFIHTTMKRWHTIIIFKDNFFQAKCWTSIIVS